MVFGARLLQKPAMLVTSREREVEASIHLHFTIFFVFRSSMSKYITYVLEKVLVQFE